MDWAGVGLDGVVAVHIAQSDAACVSLEASVPTIHIPHTNFSIDRLQRGLDTDTWTNKFTHAVDFFGRKETWSKVLE